MRRGGPDTVVVARFVVRAARRLKFDLAQPCVVTSLPDHSADHFVIVISRQKKS
jgi:hypothetical protein